MSGEDSGDNVDVVGPAVQCEHLVRVTAICGCGSVVTRESVFNTKVAIKALLTEGWEIVLRHKKPHTAVCPECVAARKEAQAARATKLVELRQKKIDFMAGYKRERAAIA